MNDGYVFPLDMQCGLPYLDMQCGLPYPDIHPLVLVHSAADAYDKKSGVKECATRNAYSHDIDAHDPVDYLYAGYNLDADIGTIYASAANTREGMIMSDCFCQMMLEGHKIWISFSTLTDSFGSACGWGGDRGRGTFARQRDKTRNKLFVNFHDRKPTDMVSTATINTSMSTDLDSNLVVHACDYFDMDLDTLYAHVANHRTEVNKKKHTHWKPPKLSSLPPADVQCMLTNKRDIHVNGVKYNVKRANLASLPMDIVVEEVTYEVSMALVLPASNTPDPSVPTYHVSTSHLSQKTGTLIDQGAHGGIAGADCGVVDCYTKNIGSMPLQ